MKRKTYTVQIKCTKLTENKTFLGFLPLVVYSIWFRFSSLKERKKRKVKRKGAGADEHSTYVFNGVLSDISRQLGAES